MTERERSTSSRIRKGAQRVLEGWIARQILKEQDPYEEARRSLIDYIGDDYLRSSAKFGALKKRLRIEQAVVSHSKIFNHDSTVIREMVAGNFYDLLDGVVSSDEALDSITCHPRNSLAIIRATITMDGGDPEREESQKIFTIYKQAAQQTVVPSGSQSNDNFRIHYAATRAFAKDMLPLLRKDWRQRFINPKR